MSRFIIVLRSLFRNRITSGIIIAGFTISISMALVLIAFLINEFSIDKGYHNIDNICRIKSPPLRLRVAATAEQGGGFRGVQLAELEGGDEERSV